MATWKSGMHLYPIDGAQQRVAQGRRPPGRTETRNWAQVIVGVDPDPAERGEIRDWCIGYWEALHPYSLGGGPLNMMGLDEGQERVQATYRDNYERLTQIKAQYDPDNFFHVNQNIRPAA